LTEYVLFILCANCRHSQWPRPQPALGRAPPVDAVRNQRNVTDSTDQRKLAKCDTIFSSLPFAFLFPPSPFPFLSSHTIKTPKIQPVGLQKCCELSVVCSVWLNGTTYQETA